MPRKQQQIDEAEPARSWVLSADENERCRQYMSHPKCAALTMGVVQLFVTDPPSHSEWRKVATGVVGFIKDWNRRSFFMRLFDLESERLVWEQEIFDEMNNIILVDDVHFCYFEAHECLAGLLFANENDARRFKEVVDSKMSRRIQASATPTPTKTDRPLSGVSLNNSQISSTSRPQSDVVVDPGSAEGELLASLHLRTKEVEHGSKELQNRMTLAEALAKSQTAKNGVNDHDANEESKKKSKKKKYKCFPSGRMAGSRDSHHRKFEISAPIIETFKVETHFGNDSASSIDFNDPAVKLLISGISDLGRMTTRKKEFIEDFLRQHGGMDAVRHYISLPMLVVSSNDIVRSASMKTAFPLRPPPTPPPPPPISAPPRLDEPDVHAEVSADDAHQTSEAVDDGIGSNENFFPPPPADYYAAENNADRADEAMEAAAAAVEPSMVLPQVPSEHLQLMDAIKHHGGLTNLRKVGDSHSSGGGSERMSTAELDPRDQILSQIRGGVTLKKVEPPQKNKKLLRGMSNTPGAAGSNTDLASALRKALIARRDILEQSSDDDSGKEAEEWDC